MIVILAEGVESETHSRYRKFPFLCVHCAVIAFNHRALCCVVHLRNKGYLVDTFANKVLLLLDLQAYLSDTLWYFRAPGYRGFGQVAIRVIEESGGALVDSWYALNTSYTTE